MKNESLQKVAEDLAEVKREMMRWEFNSAWRKVGEAMDRLEEMGYTPSKTRGTASPSGRQS